MQAVNIIVIGFRLGKIEKNCLNSIVCHTTYPYLLTYYDNYENKYTLTEIWNELIDSSVCEYVCLLNNDTEVTPKWLEKLVETLEDKEDCGFVGPSTNNCHSPQKTISTASQAELLGRSELAMKDPISGFCLLFRKALWEDLGGFDPQYKHYGQESDFIDRAQQVGWKPYWRQDAYVYHIGEASVVASGMDVTAARQEAKDIYWSTRKK